MGTNLKRFCAWMLTVVMLISMLPVNVFAADLDQYREALFQTYGLNPEDFPEFAGDAADTQQDEETPAQQQATESSGNGQTEADAPEQPSDGEKATEDASDGKEDSSPAGAVSVDDAISGDKKESTEDQKEDASEEKKEDASATENGGDDSAHPSTDGTGNVPAADEIPEVELDNFYDIDFVPDDGILVRFVVKEAKNVHIVTRGEIDIAFAADDELLEDDEFEPVRIQPMTDNCWHFEAGSYLLHFASLDNASGTVTLLLMSDEVAVQYFAEYNIIINEVIPMAPHYVQEAAPVEEAAVDASADAADEDTADSDSDADATAADTTETDADETDDATSQLTLDTESIEGFNTEAFVLPNAVTDLQSAAMDKIIASFSDAPADNANATGNSETTGDDTANDTTGTTETTGDATDATETNETTDQATGTDTTETGSTTDSTTTPDSSDTTETTGDSTDTTGETLNSTESSGTISRS